MITKEFVIAGKAIFTVEVPKDFADKYNTKAHYTYRVSKKSFHDGDRWFVKLLTGPDNTADYTYLGMVFPEGNFALTNGSRLPLDSWPVKILIRVLANVWAETQQAIEDKGWKLHHEGRCGKCGRTLTVPESIKTGIGPDCAKQMKCEKPSTKYRDMVGN